MTVCADAQSWKAIIPLGGNAWIKPPAKITDEGLIKWSDSKNPASIYFRISQPQTLTLALRLKVAKSESNIKVSIGGASFNRTIGNTTFDTINIGKVTIRKAGYVKVDLQGISKASDVFAEVTDLIVSGDKADDDVEYVKQGSSFHFGRRGPSVHLRFPVPEAMKKDVRWFYNEITVPKGNDVIGSYFMADGFGEGYFGMQVNSPTERRVLFSVWSPFKTDDAKAIPDSMKIRLMMKGKDVHTGEFGNEGAGGQSYKRFNWQTGKTYAFLLGAEPDNGGRSTTYTAYFKDIAAGKWYLIASFSRPQTNTYLTSLYSFLENFHPDGGDIARMALYGNQWAADTKGNWQELTKAVYTFDATARGKFRKDYQGGVKDGRFYLQNCGFFNIFTSSGEQFTRDAKGQRPAIHIKSLPVE
ncbi:DUF3472 domain-containing protein [Mucilaginibacter myungsuensis]|uniref:DUF5077 domain-containing protein n=1 Tax=Mucilaginibacter myungsuensis TaxID=649104 RepID=A0A929L0Y0_9SPHI|nr:DUF3472 domain-containing protein [Mucilaginibacter myungsuensis]MBE9664225.1 DUF5077 domain-containing protein [Mucilaginibacter myungsuensis]MDN3599929.1 DUF5077 domain-containing protein [Mucilaginibacter myungsuensis]